MLFKLFILVCVIQTCFTATCDDCNNGYTRIKRSKYYSHPPPRFYRKPPMSHPIRGPFSYTPPPGYAEDGDKNPGPPSPPYKVSKHKEGLGEEDFSNLIKYLSKQDLDRIVELAGDRDRRTDRPKINDQREILKNEPEFDPNQMTPFTNDDYKTSNVEYIPSNYVQIKPDNSGSDQPFKSGNQVPNYLEIDESRHSEQFSYLDSHIQKELHNHSPPNYRDYKRENVIFTNSDTMQEESLPKPDNLREESDYEVSHTNNIPSFVKADSYKVENFANLPLMNYELSKLETVNSYSVPHYTVTSTRNQGPPSQPPASFPSPKPVSQASLAAQQSDAHLKAVKIWTHKSTGTAYTLHDDGTLSLEKPLRPKRKF